MVSWRVPFVGDRSPVYIEITVSDPDFDFTTVSEVQATVTAPNGIRRTWDWSYEPGDGSVVLGHILAEDGSDFEQAGVYVVNGYIITPETRRRFVPVFIPVDPSR